MKNARPEQAVPSRSTDMSTTDATRAATENMADGLNANRIADIGAFVASDLAWCGNWRCGTRMGRRGERDNWQKPFRAAFPERVCTDEARLCTREWAAVFGRQEVKQPGTFTGVAPTGKRIQIRCMDCCKLVGGKIVDNRVMEDFPHVLAQLGVDVSGRGGCEAFDRGDRAPPAP